MGFHASSGFADEVVGLLEGPQERLVLRRALRRCLEGDPGFRKFAASVVGRPMTAGFGEFEQHALALLQWL
jgi:hypothetical protein